MGCGAGKREERRRIRERNARGSLKGKRERESAPPSGGETAGAFGHRARRFKIKLEESSLGSAL